MPFVGRQRARENSQVQVLIRRRPFTVTVIDLSKLKLWHGMESEEGHTKTERADPLRAAE